MRFRAKTIFSNAGMKSFFSSPFFLALIISAVIIYFLPPIVKYKLELIKEFPVDKKDGLSYYDDLDNDGYSEYIISYSNIINEHSVKVTTHDNKLINQWNFYKKKPPRINDSGIYTGDYNEDGYKELFVISWEKDSVFLDIICPMKPSAFERRDIFIDKIADYVEERDFQVAFSNLIDLNDDGFKEIIFEINAGFSIQPRRTYMYDVNKNRLVKSPESGVHFNNKKYVDLDGDGRIEILGNTSGPGNIKPEWNIPYDDSSSWLMVLDEKLEFEFEPVEYPAYKSSIGTLPVQFNDTNYILVLFYNSGVQKMKSSLYLLDVRGKQIKKRELPEAITNPKLIEFQENKIFQQAFLLDENNGLYNISEDLELVFNKPMENIQILYYDNLDKDADTEYVSITSEAGNIKIMNGLFEDMVNFELKNPYDSRIRVSTKLQGEKKKYLFVQKAGICCLLDYKRNSFYSYRILVYIAIFLAVWLFMYAVQRIYRHQLLKQQALSRRISELQFNSINNQINPHFIFNAMNSITSAIYNENKEEAYHFGTKFSNLMRESLMSAESISRTLDKEIKFVKDYLDLEKFRFKDAFDYEISIDPAVDLNMEVPKTIIQTFAENAVKHGLNRKEKGGRIRIEIRNRNEKLLITVEDNGIGRQEAAKLDGDGTGKGFGIIEQIFDLYYKLSGVKLHYSITDLKQKNPAAQGTRVEVVIRTTNLKRVIHPLHKQ